MSKLLTGSINLSKIDKSRLFTSEKTGDKYLNIAVWINDEKDNYDNDASIQQQVAKGENKIFIGNLKYFESKQQNNIESAPPPEEDDSYNLPF